MWELSLLGFHIAFSDVVVVVFIVFVFVFDVVVIVVVVVAAQCGIVSATSVVPLFLLLLSPCH